MAILVYLGAACAVIGILLIGYCMTTAISIRKETDQDEANKKLQGLVAWNLGALSLSALGLIMIVVGMVL